MKFSRNIRHPFVLAIAVALLVCLSLRTWSGEGEKILNVSGAEKLILIIMNYRSLFCPLCLEIFQDFCGSLHACKQEEFALGILVDQEADNLVNREKEDKIVEKQLKGLVIGNNIRFPFIYDKSHLLEGLNWEGVTIVLLDRSRRLFKKFTLPLTSEQREEVFAF